MITCPVCKGEGQCLPHNGVVQGKNDPEECWLCHGTGKVKEVKHDTKLHITKYWNTNQLIEKVLNDNIEAWQTLANE